MSGQSGPPVWSGTLIAWLAYVYRILSLDGGGIRGVLTATLLKRIEANCPGFLAKADLLAGTSAGGILALGLASGLSPAECCSLCEALARAVFADSAVDDLRDLGNAVGAQYSNTPLKRLLTGHFGNRVLGDLPRKVLICAFDLDNEPASPFALRTWKPKFFHNFPGSGSDAGERVVDVALRTSAAPTYFPIYQGYIDGGVVANNPAMCALAQALDAQTGGQKLEEVALLSVGTGRVPRFLTVKEADWGWAQWARPLIDLLLEEGSSSLSDFQCQRLLGERYFRLDPLLPDTIRLDDLSQIPRLKELAKEMDLTAVLDWLKPAAHNRAGTFPGWL